MEKTPPVGPAGFGDHQFRQFLSDRSKTNRRLVQVLTVKHTDDVRIEARIPSHPPVVAVFVGLLAVGRDDVHVDRLVNRIGERGNVVVTEGRDDEAFLIHVLIFAGRRGGS